MDLWEFSFINTLFLDVIFSKGLIFNLFEHLIDLFFALLLVYFSLKVEILTFFFSGRITFPWVPKFEVQFFELFVFLSPFEDSEDSLDKDESDSEDIVSTESLSDVKNSILNFFFVDDLPEISSFNEWLLVKIEKQKDYMLIEWTK